MSGCVLCGRRTPNRKCRDCQLADQFGETRRDEPEPADPEPYRCSNCGEVHEGYASTPCPECDARRKRYAGDLDVASVGGEP